MGAQRQASRKPKDQEGTAVKHNQVQFGGDRRCLRCLRCSHSLLLQAGCAMAYCMTLLAMVWFGLPWVRVGTSGLC